MAGSWGTPAPQPLQNGDYSMVSTKFFIFSDNHPLILHSMKPSIPYSNIRQGNPYYESHFGTEQVPGPTMSLSAPPYLPEADPNQDVFSEWRFHPCRVSHAEEDEIHLTYGNDAYGGGSISGYGSDPAMAEGSWGTLAPQPLQNGDFSMVSTSHQMSNDNHRFILLFHEVKYSIQQPRRTLPCCVPFR